MESAFENLVHALETIHLFAGQRFRDEKIDVDDDIIRRVLEQIEDKRNWSQDSFRNVFTRETVAWGTPEYEEIALLFNSTLPRAEIVSMERVQNPYLYAQYRLKKMQKEAEYGYVLVKRLFHGTKRSNVISICKNNFNWRLVGTSGYLGCKFGRGVAFSPNSSYASGYPRGAGAKESPKVMFVARVMEVGRCVGYEGLVIPREGIDTSIRSNGDVVVKFCDNEYYPEYIIYYNK